jgi:hypothetical protein
MAILSFIFLFFFKQNLQQDFSIYGKKKDYCTYTRGKHIPIMLDIMPYQAYLHKKGNKPDIMGNHKPIPSH